VKLPVKFARNVSTGDLSHTLKSKNKDEIGFLLTTINQMVISYGKIASEVISNSNNLKTSSINLVTTARDLSNAFKQMTEQSSNVTHTSKDMSDQISNISL
jgi:methyl-accepting chemotaxis protein